MFADRLDGVVLDGLQPEQEGGVASPHARQRAQGGQAQARVGVLQELEELLLGALLVELAGGPGRGQADLQARVVEQRRDLGERESISQRGSFSMFSGVETADWR